MAKIYFDRADMFYGASAQMHEFAKQLRNNETECEQLLWKQLNKKQLAGFRFRRQHPIKYFIADFYCHKAKLVIEIDGGIHQLPHQFEYDQGRDYELVGLGLTVFRYTNQQVLTSMDSVIKQIEDFIINTQNSL